jgi:hypothetical protein
LTHLLEATGATGHDLLDLRMSAVLGCTPICGAEVLFLDLFVPHRWYPGWGPCSDADL